MPAPNNLPEQLTSFVGRELEIAEIARLLPTTRLLTLIGTGGSGKTRLSIRAACTLLDEYSDGVWFVGLDALSDPSLVPQAVASTLGLREESGRSLTTMLAESIRNSRVLIVLDNCEHLVSACALLADSLLRLCPNLRIIATSRQSLGIGGEITWPVPSLTMPSPEQETTAEELLHYEAVQLFVERANAVRPGFKVTQGNAAAVRQLCSHLDGLPLAIELAAARVKVLSVEQIAERLVERFRLLTTGSVTALPRQQTLRALMDWSYELLPEDEQKMLRQLSVFSGSFTLEAAHAVCGTSPDEYETIDLLSMLVDKSLVTVEERYHEARYRQLETIRQYAWEKLRGAGEAAEVRRKHGEWYVDLAEHGRAELVSGEQGQWLDRLEWEHDNLRAALEWCIRGEPNAEAALQLSGALWRFWDMRGYISEGRRWLEEALTIEGDVSVQGRTRALSAAGNMAIEQGDYRSAEIWHRQALDLRRREGDKRGVAASLSNLGVVARSQGDYDLARQLYEESLATFRELEAKPAIAGVLNNLGFVAQCQRQYDRATELYMESLNLAQEMEDSSGIALELNNLGETAQQSGNYEKAAAYYNQALELLRDLSDKLGVADVLNNLASLAHSHDEYEEAVRLYKESLTLSRQLENRPGMVTSLEGLAIVESHSRPRRAARLGGAVESLREKIGTRLSPYQREQYDQHMERVRTELGEKAFEMDWVAGWALSMQAAVDFALADSSAALPEVPSVNGVERELAAVAQPMPEAPPPPSEGPYPGDLTRREVEVLRLVAGGLTDAQVAAELGISVRTVHAHLHSIYEKLGVTTRGAATRYAMEMSII